MKLEANIFHKLARLTKLPKPTDGDRIGLDDVANLLLANKSDRQCLMRQLMAPLNRR
jgi:hypothetical protein